MSKLPEEFVGLAADLYRPVGVYALQFAAGKLAGDPVFVHLLRHGLLAAPSPTQSATTLLDFGCGQGLLGACCLVARQLAARGQWPADWAPPPAIGHYCGIELVDIDAKRGARALSPHDPDFACKAGDLRRCEFGTGNIAVLLDVLHYLPTADHIPLLSKIHAALTPDGRLITRIGDAKGTLLGRIARWIDMTVWFARTGQRKSLHYRSVDEWRTLITHQGFAIESAEPVPGERFANVLIVARRVQQPLKGGQSR